MMNRMLLCVSLAALSLTMEAPAFETRKWYDVTGKHKIEAEFIAIKDGKVTLKKTDGKTVVVPVAKLSREDREYIRDQVSSIRKEKKEKEKGRARDNDDEEDEEGSDEDEPRRSAGRSGGRRNDARRGDGRGTRDRSRRANLEEDAELAEDEAEDAATAEETAASGGTGPTPPAAAPNKLGQSLLGLFGIPSSATPPAATPAGTTSGSGGSTGANTVVQADGQIQVTARARLLTDSEGENYTALEVALQLSGAQGTDVISYGHLLIERAIGDDGKNLVLQRLPTSRDPTLGYVAIDKGTAGQPERNPYQQYGRPGTEIRIAFAPAEIGGIEELKGSVKLRSGGDRDVIQLDSLTTRPAGPVEGPQLSAAIPLKLTFSRINPTTIALQADGDINAIASIAAVNATGQPIELQSWSVSRVGAQTRYDFQFPAEIPPDARLEVELVKNAIITEVPFELTQIEVSAE